ncbi:hypothetical protein ACKWRH_28065 [Bradyrhizobium sp. Pa8]|uniref:hypothetical protein n=1 Tax=Bradyrhizobium sp. Pa8 TaxID=3386552 RepID=UPI00403F19F9
MPFDFRHKCAFAATGWILILAAVGLSAHEASAQPSLSSVDFQSNPGGVLERNKDGGAILLTLIRNLAVDDPATLSSILTLLSTANKDQKLAIGAGLAQAAKIVVVSNPTYASEIQQAIARTKDQDVVLAFAAASGDQPTGETGAGGGAGGDAGGGSGGQTGSTNRSFGTPSVQSIGQGGVTTGNFSISSAVSSASAPSSNTTSRISNSVSP